MSTGEKRIFELTETQSFGADDYLALDNINNTEAKKIKAKTVGKTYTIEDTEDGFTFEGDNGYSHNVHIPDVEIEEKTASGEIATFDDGGENIPMKSVVCEINPLQEGSGDPSPTNVRPITGWSAVNVNDVGDNWGDCADIPEPLTANKRYEVNLPYNNYTISFDAVNVERGHTGNTSLFNINGSKNILADRIYSVEDGSTYQSKGASVNGRFYFTYTGKFSSIGCYWRSNTYQFLTSGSLENIMIEVGANPTKQFKPYQGTTYTIQFKDGDNPLTVYGGTLDVVSGELKVVPYYNSYNDETLEGEWISDRDVYAVGTTPTIGAQVVNIGATPQIYQLTPTQVKSLLGTNNVWHDCNGDISVTYVKGNLGGYVYGLDKQIENVDAKVENIKTELGTAELQTTDKTIKGAINELDARDKATVSDKYNNETGTYAVGDTAIYENELYVCNTPIPTPEDFDSTKWDKMTLGEYCAEIKSNLTEYTTLYEDASGTDGNVTLDDNVNNYDYIKVFYNYGSYGSSSVDVFDYSKGFAISLPYMSAWQGTNYLQIHYKRCDVSGTTITVVKTGYANIFNGRYPEIDAQANNIIINKVIGVKLQS